VNTSLTTVTILVTLIHVAALGVMLWIRVRRSEADGPTGERANTKPCALCGEPSTHWGYDGLDPHEQRNRHTGLPYSNDMAHYQPLCPAH
jgi:hypothetical protein